MRYWRPEDIFTVACPQCHGEIEFWKDEAMRLCRACGVEVRNPRIDLGCADWCKHGAACLGKPMQSDLAGQTPGTNGEHTHG